MNILTQKYIKRFWGKVDKEKSQTFYNGTRCWEWKAGTTKFGYGRWFVGKMVYSHRTSFELTYGEIPDGLFVLHHCDNPLCVNPEHLFLGTRIDNVRDMDSKGRRIILHREEIGTHKLTNKQVEEIRQRYSFRGINGDSGKELAKEYGISPAQIVNIVNNRQWK